MVVNNTDRNTTVKECASADITGIIILAAGASTRLGTPKQLLNFEGKTLLNRILETAKKTQLKTVVVLGSNAEKIQKTIKDPSIDIVVNENWKIGMSSSIKTGLKTLLKIEPDLSTVILLLCDQPFITNDTILRLIRTQSENTNSIVACEYGNTIGTPALFTKEIFEELLNLEGDKGAKPLIKKYKDTNLSLISAPEAAFDIDTMEDFDHLTGAQASCLHRTR